MLLYIFPALRFNQTFPIQFKSKATTCKKKKSLLLSIDIKCTKEVEGPVEGQDGSMSMFFQNLWPVLETVPRQCDDDG